MPEWYPTTEILLTGISGRKTERQSAQLILRYSRHEGDGTHGIADIATNGKVGTILTYLSEGMRNEE